MEEKGRWSRSGCSEVESKILKEVGKDERLVVVRKAQAAARSGERTAVVKLRRNT